jgi:hypothetical protein
MQGPRVSHTFTLCDCPLCHGSPRRARGGNTGEEGGGWEFAGEIKRPKGGVWARVVWRESSPRRRDRRVGVGGGGGVLWAPLGWLGVGRARQVGAKEEGDGAGLGGKRSWPDWGEGRDRMNWG